MARTESDRAADVMDEIVTAGWRLSLGDPVVRPYALGGVALLSAIALLTLFLVGGGLPAVGIVAALLAPATAAALVVGAVRAAVLELVGDRSARRAEPANVAWRAFGRAPDLVGMSLRVPMRRELRSPLTAAVMAVNGLDPEPAARTSQALLARYWGERAVVRCGLLFAGLFVLPVTAVDALVYVSWPHLGFVRPLALLVAVGLTIVGLVVALACDAAIRGALLRTVRGDATAIDPAVVAAVVCRRDGRGGIGGAYTHAMVALVVGVVALALLPQQASSWFATLVLGPAVVGAVYLLTRAFRAAGPAAP